MSYVLTKEPKVLDLKSSSMKVFSFAPVHTSWCCASSPQKEKKLIVRLARSTCYKAHCSVLCAYTKTETALSQKFLDESFFLLHQSIHNIDVHLSREKKRN